MGLIVTPLRWLLGAFEEIGWLARMAWEIRTGGVR